MVLCARALARSAADPPGSRAYRAIIALAVAAGAVFRRVSYMARASSNGSAAVAIYRLARPGVARVRPSRRSGVA